MGYEKKQVRSYTHVDVDDRADHKPTDTAFGQCAGTRRLCPKARRIAQQGAEGGTRPSPSRATPAGTCRRGSAPSRAAGGSGPPRRAGDSAPPALLDTCPQISSQTPRPTRSGPPRATEDRPGWTFPPESAGACREGTAPRRPGPDPVGTPEVPRHGAAGPTRRCPASRAGSQASPRTRTSLFGRAAGHARTRYIAPSAVVA
jgi:hypothetical protein